MEKTRVTITLMNKDTENMYTIDKYHAGLAVKRERLDLAEVIWLGTSRDELRTFPKAIQQDLGYALYQVQLGQMPPDSKPMKTVGAGVYELREQDSHGWYRVIYVKKIKARVFVLHCFQKKSARTDERDIRTAKDRFKQLQQQQRKQEHSAE